MSEFFFRVLVENRCLGYFYIKALELGLFVSVDRE